ncbi:hypothetical protein PAHAL_8G038400 [Panicum hallii]|uniref:Uncharacterized protein n=1 Tax=Panicum hallii TaxID=206008 RepID=A0A2T8I7K3_9POAL|nr:hypothetical protein PAHAL_8G038400 [Panicum hallii]
MAQRSHLGIRTRSTIHYYCSPFQNAVEMLKMIGALMEMRTL